MTDVTLDSIHELHRTLDDALNYVSQAQIIVEDSGRKGADILHGIGARVETRLANEIDRWAT